ncbi:hypothetical protein K438DRAFT_2097228 [Mycena galopus ATCC 62051]|nr:hypothetical protein K438DRAFT_2097228 [Mycena galopus ATCC 62051]
MCESGKRETDKQGHTAKTRTGGGGEDKRRGTGGLPEDIKAIMSMISVAGARRQEGMEGRGREREGKTRRRESGGNEREGSPSPAPEGAKRTIDQQVERGVHHTKTRAPSRRIHAGSYAPARAVQGGSPNKSAERRRAGEVKRVTAAVVDADDVALGQDRPHPLLGLIVESYTSAATVTVEATEKVAVRRRHNEDVYSLSSAAFVCHPTPRPFAIAVAIILRDAALAEFKRGAVLLVLLRD